ncbi:unnamed protein product [Dovyalis caffra]|uniref:25S rRNA (uridine-N(3))-methyltransferase BMT5-like domain-containing protein n=1 Tax=Dovyalis caffra TaxID=77055 RepID=A0AAV1QQB8_9ROSI|nr:unnamed protein product [Dovyalis caffra]
MMMLKYWGAASNLRDLEEFGCTIIHEVNAHSMNKHPLLNRKLFDRIVYNFPHTALKRSEGNIRQIKSHRRLVKGFFESAFDMLEENGEVHVTHKTTDPYSKWGIEKLAEGAGLFLVDKVRFRKSDYPGYENKRGAGSRADENFPAGNSCTFKFGKSTSP